MSSKPFHSGLVQAGPLKTELVHFRLAIGLLLTLFCFSCNNSPQNENRSPMDSSAPFSFPYDLENPSQKLKLTKELREISGLCWKEEERLYAVQDEDGIIYTIDFKHGKVESREEFGPAGDYEGIAREGETTWVLRSDGQLYEVRENGDVVVHETALGDHFNLEGLAWDSRREVLLLVCKEVPEKGDEMGQLRGCYVYDPVKEHFQERASLTMDLRELAVAAGEEDDELDRIFMPSGVAVHPKSGHFYFISSVGKKLAVYGGEGELLHVASLDYKHFKQPEGICFAPDGRLYIANEGGKKGRIVRFDPQ